MSKHRASSPTCGGIVSTDEVPPGFYTLASYLTILRCFTIAQLPFAEAPGKDKNMSSSEIDSLLKPTRENKQTYSLQKMEDKHSKKSKQAVH